MNNLILGQAVHHILEKEPTKDYELKEKYESRISGFFETTQVNFVAVLMKLGVKELDIGVSDLENN